MWRQHEFLQPVWLRIIFARRPAGLIITICVIMEMLLDICGYYFEYLFLTPGFVLVHLTGFLIWKYLNDVTVTLRAALPGLIVSELLLIGAWYFDCLGIFGTISVSAVCLTIFICWTQLGKITIKDKATFIAGKVINILI